MELVRGEGGGQAESLCCLVLCIGSALEPRTPGGGGEQDRRRDSRNETVVHPRKSDAVSSYVPTLKPCRLGT